MAHNKRRVVQKIMEESSLALARMQLPKEWVLHEYAPDYGIDFVVETFRFINPEQTIAETLGEFFFVQMKSTKSVSSITKKVYQRFNVEKSVREDKDTVAMIEVIPYALDVDEIQTIMSMGTAVPVVLFLADLSTNKIYWVCLTDYIEKIILPQDALKTHEASITIHIPAENVLSSEASIAHLAFLARRSKLMGAFNKFNYQKDELAFNDSEEVILRFITIVKAFDFWTAKYQWPILPIFYKELLEVEKFYLADNSERKAIVMEHPGLRMAFETMGISAEPMCQEQQINNLFFKFKTKDFWQRLGNLGNMYEEVCKEWFLPTYFWKKGPLGKSFGA